MLGTIVSTGDMAGDRTKSLPSWSVHSSGGNNERLQIVKIQSGGEVQQNWGRGSEGGGNHYFILDGQGRPPWDSDI